jgi:hypothetical protein
MAALLSMAVAGAVPPETRTDKSDKPAKRTPKEALSAFHELIGPWRATGTPEGTRAEKQKGFWTEKIGWEWRFKGTDAWLRVTFEKGKYFTGGELRYLPDKDLFQLTLTTPAKQSLTFQGSLKDRNLILEREDDKSKEEQRLVISLLHESAFLYRYEVKAPEKAQFRRLYKVSAINDRKPFASGDGQPECIVSGGLGTIKVLHNGQTYYVCCSGCRSEFLANPERYIEEYKARKEKKEKDKGK